MIPKNDYISIGVADDTFGAYVARPDQAMAPAVVVLHEVFGINADMRQTCDELAAHGLVAVCPDLFWRLEPGLDLNQWSHAEWAKGLAPNAAYDRDLGVEDLAQVLQATRMLEGAPGKAGVMGFCLGGLMAFLIAARAGGRGRRLPWR